MKFICNIDRRGRIIRTLSGVVMIAIGVAVERVGPNLGATRHWICGFCAALGAFQVLEGLTGWCMLRALGYRTPI